LVNRSAAFDSGELSKAEAMRTQLRAFERTLQNTNPARSKAFGGTAASTTGHFREEALVSSTAHFASAKTRGTRHQIEIFIDRLEQLFNSIDPSPFHEKDLDPNAEEFIMSWAQEFRARDPLSLIIHLNQPGEALNTGASVKAAVHNYFAYQEKLNRLALSRLLKEGRISLLIGLAFLTACLVASELISADVAVPFRNALHESLTIAGWVAMWRPIQIFLYDWWPLVHFGRILHKLSHVPVELKLRR